MTTTELTRQEFITANPEMDYRNNEAATNYGQPIKPSEGIKKVKAYDAFKKDPASGLKDQTISVGFDSEELISWLQGNKALIDEVKVFFSLDEEKKLTVVFWPYKAGLPATDTNKDDGTLLEPYNIGNRNPLI